MRHRNTLASRLAVLLLLATHLRAQDSREVVNHEMTKPTVRGGIVFRNRCVLCHGQRGNSVGRAARLFENVNLAIAPDQNLITRKSSPAVERRPGWRNTCRLDRMSCLARKSATWLPT
jgi:mono/diheme cytochrome c family protein